MSITQAIGQITSSLSAAERRIRPRRVPFGLSGCVQGRHLGPMLNAARMDAAGGLWVRLATCGACGGTVDRSEFVGEVA